MRSISLLVLAGLVALSCGYIVVDQKVNTYKTDTDFLYKQKVILQLLQHVHQNEVLLKLWDEAKLWKFEDNYNYFTNVEAVQEFVTNYKRGLLPMDEIFTIYNTYHRDQVVALFHVFFYAKDFETFYKSLVWARFHVNEGMFIYALTVAVFNRPDTRGIELPAPYEIYPYYFFNVETIQQAQNYKMQGFYGMKKVEDVHTIIIPTNYTDYDYYMTNFENKISYFTEDIGLNTYYYYFHADYPFWMTGKEYKFKKERRGEQYLFTHQQLLARFYLERLSNDMGIIPEFSWYEPIKTGYYPALRYYNGAFFPERNNFYNMYIERNYYDISIVLDYERRIRDAIDLGYIIMPDGTHFDLTKPETVEYLGNLIQYNGDSFNRRFYGYFIWMSKLILGGSVNDLHTFKYDYKILPSVLEHYETTLRDPVFWQLYKRIIKFYWQFKDTLPSYKKELIFDDVKIQSVEMDKLVTFFDKFDSDITNAVDVELFDKKTFAFEKTSDLFKFGKVSHYMGEDFVIKARQWRLNHKPFSFKLNVYSNRAVKSVVRVYMGPKYDEFGRVFDVNANRENFVLLDLFKYDLVFGDNVITRDSNDFTWYVKDTTTFFDLYKKTMMVKEGKSKWDVTDYTEARFGFPDRLMLPKGKKGGMPVQFFFMVSPYFESTDDYYVDALPFGYPFDRKIDETYWFTPNMFYYDTNIFHKKEYEINTVYPTTY
ncbi:Larval serum protein 2 [Pseudolycoriella hygida]|uniref:Larval serum protein 2 n=1 Tax=Pseudolycoriella hygida TaxID=35572 RepID=A0A9Q0MUZ1_9DIPT|nr:Larval serum protein 2 [Pseudolycoriella hygida]